MVESFTLLALFADIDPAAAAVEKLDAMGVSHDEVNIISGIPVAGRVLGRPTARTHVPQIALAGAGLGILCGLFLIYGIPSMYLLPVGGQPTYPIPQGLITTFEMMVLGLLGFAFLGMFVDSGLPSYTPKEYIPEISNGKIAVLFSCEAKDEQRFSDEMRRMGAESVERAEARTP